MSKSKLTDVLTDPAIKRHTERILALQEEERQTRIKLGSVIAAIGAELLAVKAALDLLSNKTAWLRWLKTHVHYSAKTAQHYMAVARLCEKTKALPFFLTLAPTVLYRIAALPDDIIASLSPDTLLTDPRTGRQTALQEMSTRTLDRALDALEGKTAPETPRPVSTDVVLSGETREAFASDAQRLMGQLSSRLTEIRGRKGALTGTSKQRVLEAIENLRRIVLKWPAWASPDADKTGIRAP
jgi:hypothetical protein